MNDPYDTDATNAFSQRREHRSIASTAIFWRTPDANTASMGWLLESAPSGLAFAFRGANPPRPGTHILVQRSFLKSQPTWETAIVRRTNTPHADLTIVAVEILKSAPTRTQAAAFAELKAWQDDPHRTYADLSPPNAAA